MRKRNVLMSVLLTMVMSLVGMSASADNVTTDTSGATSFLYEGRSYVPLKSTANFLGAPLRWDAEKGQAVITYNGMDLALTPNNLNALLDGKPVELTSPPVVVDGMTYVPTDALRKFYNVPVEWDGAKSEVKIKGPSGWRTMKASSRAPWHGGPPPWAPAWGRRGQDVPGVQLTSDQKQRIAEIREQTRSRIQRIKRDNSLTREEQKRMIKEAQQKGHENVMVALTSDQRRQFDERWQAHPNAGKAAGKSSSHGATGNKIKAKGKSSPGKTKH